MDEFSKTFNELWFGSNSSANAGDTYSYYRDPNTGEMKYYSGELPLKTGLPPNIEEGTEAAMKYKQEQIDVYGFPRAIIADENIQDIKKQRQETVVTDPNWARASKMLHQFMEPDQDKFKSDKEASEWGIDFMSSFENNFTNMVFDIAAMESAPPQVWHAMYYLMETSDREGILMSNFKKGLYYTVFDYSNLVGLGTMGIGLIGKSAGKQLSKVGFKEALKRIVMSKPDASDYFMMAEGATYAGGFNLSNQAVRIGAGKQDDINVGEAAISTGVGTAAGPVISRVGQGVMEGVKRGAGAVGDMIRPSAETKAAQNVGEIIDDTVGVNPNQTTQNVDPAPVNVTNPRRIKTTGQYVGAPKGIDSPQKLSALRTNMMKIAKAGEEGRFWYERSGNAILDLVDGNVDEADKIAQAIAITSAGSTPVLANFQFAIQAYNQHKAGREIFTGKFPTAMSARLKDLFDGKNWEGRKTNTFYNNIMASVDPKRTQGVTVDMHMLRVFGFDKKNEMPSQQQYTFVENEVNRIANKLGWTPYQVQAAMWVVQKATKANKPVSEMKFDYKDALERNLGQISWETKPSKASGHFAEIFNAPMNEQADFHFKMSKALTDDNGKDLIAKEFGLLSPGSFDAPGVFEGVVSPGTQTYALMPMKYKGKTGEVDEATLDLVKMYAVTRGILLKQDGMGFHRPFYKQGTPKRDLNGFDINIGRKFTEAEIIELDKLIAEKTGMDFLSPVSTETGVRLLNFTDGQDGQIPNVDYQRMILEALDIFQISDIKVEGGMQVKQFKAQLGYVENNWKDAPNGEIYLNSSFPGRSDLQARVSTVVTKYADRIDAVEDEIVQQYGWTKLDYNSKYRGKQTDGGVDTTTPPNNEGGE